MTNETTPDSGPETEPDDALEALIAGSPRGALYRQILDSWDDEDDELLPDWLEDGES